MGLQGVLGHPHHLLLQRGLEVDQEVAAADEVHPGKRRVGQHVMAGEYDGIPDGLADPVAAVRLGEEPPQPLRGDILSDGPRIEAHAGFLYPRRVQVRGEDLQGDLQSRRLGELGEGDREGIGLFSRRAADRPDAHRVMAGTILGQPRKHPGLEHLEGVWIPEEARDADEHVPIERVRLAGIALEESRVVRQTLQLVKNGAADDAPVERVPLVVREIDAAGDAQQFQDSLEGWPVGQALFTARGDKGMLADPGDLLRDLTGRQHEVDAAGGHRALRHALVLGGVVLSEGDATLGLDGLQPEGAVGGRAGEDDPYRPVALRLGQRAQEMVDGTVVAPRLGARREL